MSVALNQLNALDPAALSELKRLARDGSSPEGLQQAARQFEGLFMQMVLKAMRDATPSSGLFDSDQTRMLQGLHDQQMAMNIAQGRGVGLADVIARQLGGQSVPARTPDIGADGRPVFDLASVPRRPANPAFRQRDAEIAAAEAGAAAARGGAAAMTTDAMPKAAPAGVAAAAPARTVSPSMSEEAPAAIPEHVRTFVERVWPHAEAASRKLGIPAQFLVAQAALETGWGRGELHRADGRPSHNLFNIKAGRNWQGPVIELPVTEYANGRAYTEAARFRAYGSYEEAFRDYVRLLQNSPRYADVLNQQDAAGFARSLQDAGFATDPEYANKVARIIGGNSLQTAIADRLV
ncbi:MAG TPA: flagellar assembly peptidoglycan hydrolase FlgJ [Rhodocyclaceae bacterium]|nr:flagellar assembly peptidoglycan hydrolase FlgJ [Rhodocyclaceae bacterium]